jgi:hypothetical protein
MRRALVTCAAVVAVSLIPGGLRAVSTVDEFPDASVQIRMDRYDFQGKREAPVAALRSHPG